MQILRFLLLPYEFGFFLFLFIVFWIFWLGLPVISWMKLVWVNILVLFLNIGGYCTVLVFIFFPPLGWSYLWAFHIQPLLCFSKLKVFRDFIMNGCCFLSSAFLASLVIIIWFLCFVVLMLCITLTDLQILDHAFNREINPTRSLWIKM